MTSTDHVEWMQGNFFMLIHTQFTGGATSGMEVAVLGYDSAKNAYTYSSYNSMGEHETATGTVDGDTWTWNSESSGAPGNMKWRFIEKIISPTSYTMKFEMAPDGNTWSTVMQGKATKQ